MDLPKRDVAEQDRDDGRTDSIILDRLGQVQPAKPTAHDHRNADGQSNRYRNLIAIQTENLSNRRPGTPSGDLRYGRFERIVHHVKHITGACCLMAEVSFRTVEALYLRSRGLE